MNSIKKYLTSVVTGIIVVGINGCNLVSDSNTRGKISFNNNTESTLIAQRENSPNNSNEITVTVYRADNQCEGFIPQQLKVSQQNSLDAAVAKVIEMQNNGDFAIAGYRVQVDQSTKVATIDFRLPANTQRQFISLSPCELFSLFGSLRQTLTTNSQWNIKEVHFTEKGKEIFL